MTDDLHVGACPNDEQLAAYAEGLLSGEERLAVERHLAECETCREVVAEAVRLQAEPLPVRVLPFWKRPKVRAIGGGVLALAASLILVVQLRPEWNPFQRGSTYGDLVSAVGARRPIEARLTGGFEYGPRPSASRSNDARTADYTVLAAAARIQAEAARQPTAQNLHALGVAHLVLAEYDRAILALEKAVELERLQPVSYSDLAAAYLARAQRQNRPTDFPKAVAAAEKALTSPGAPSEAYFNRALALEALNLRASAMSAWKEYLKIDPSGPWSDEARARLRDLERKEGSLLWPAIRDQVLSGRVETARSVLPAMVRPVRLILEDELLPKWAELYLAGGRHQETMKEARELAVLLDAATASRTASRYVDAISLAFRSADRVQSLAEGHALYGAARRLYENDSVAQARVKFLESEAHLRSGGSPLAGWARLHVGIADYYSGQTDGAFEQFGALLNKDAVTTDPILRGRAAWMSGLVRSSRGDLEGALADYGTALRQFEGAK